MANLPSLLPIVAKETAAVQTAGLCCKLLLMRVHAPPLKVSVEGAAPLIRLYLSSFFIALLRTFSLAIMPASLHPERGCNRMCS